MVLKEGLPFEYEVKGTVRDAVSYVPIEGASINIIGRDADGRDISKSFQSAANGKYSISIPYSHDAYGIYIQAGTYSSFSIMLYLNITQMSYGLDADLNEYASTPLNVQFIDEVSSDPLILTSANIQGLAAYSDHIPFYRSFMGFYNGWVNTTAGKGEYRYDFSFRQSYDTNTLAYTGRCGLIMDDSPVTIQEPVPVPHEFRYLRLNVVEDGSTTPMPSANIYSEFVSVDDGLFDLHAQSFGHSNATGYASVPLIPERDYIVYVEAVGHERKTMEIPAGPSSEDVVMTVGLKEVIYVPPETADISVLAIDQLTGKVLPQFFVLGEGDGVSFYSMTNNFGYLNTSIPVDITIE